MVVVNKLHVHVTDWFYCRIMFPTSLIDKLKWSCVLILQIIFDVIKISRLSRDMIPQLGLYMPISSQNNLGEVTNANYMGVTSCYQRLIGGNKCQGVESGAGFGPYMWASPSLIRVFTVRMKKAWVLSYPLSAQRRLWSDWADAQADLNLRWAHTHFVGFVMSRLRWRCNNTVPSFPVFRCPQGLSKPHSCPFLDGIFPSLLLSSSPSCSFHCPLHNRLRHASGSWDVAIPSEFPFLYHG